MFNLSTGGNRMPAIILGVLFGLSETLSLIPSIKSNSVFQLIYNTIASLAGKPALMLGKAKVTPILKPIEEPPKPV